jgi:hypothetical protein
MKLCVLVVFFSLVLAVANGDGDGIPDYRDNCPKDFNPDQLNTDGDAYGDVCDPDDDNDYVLDVDDNCPLDANEDQLDSDGDGIGDVCDPINEVVDTDGDCVYDDVDNCIDVPNADQLNTDGDEMGDACDDDDDNDLLLDEEDPHPTEVMPVDLVVLAKKDVLAYAEKPVRREVKHKLNKIVWRLGRAADFLFVAEDLEEQAAALGDSKWEIRKARFLLCRAEILKRLAKVHMRISIVHLKFLESRIAHYEKVDPETADLMREMDFHDTSEIIGTAIEMM